MEDTYIRETVRVVVPSPIKRELERRAVENRRSLTREIQVTLERALQPAATAPGVAMDSIEARG